MKKNLWCATCRQSKEYGVWNPDGRLRCDDCKQPVTPIHQTFGTGPRDDELNQFINDRCYEGSDLRAPRKKLLAAYESWGGHRSKMSFALALRRALFFTCNGKRLYFGLSLRTDADALAMRNTTLVNDARERCRESRRQEREARRARRAAELSEVDSFLARWCVPGGYDVVALHACFKAKGGTLNLPKFRRALSDRSFVPVSDALRFVIQRCHLEGSSRVPKLQSAYADHLGLTHLSPRARDAFDSELRSLGVRREGLVYQGVSLGITPS